ncbi:hypothetical protein [Cohnella sp. 56]|uniref:hypothetical protein n=1 Tax=Cohnella sp. 56 TaxID=3113722 RepID=UPI0030E86835
MSGKRKYTVPVMLIIITMLTFIIVVLLSRVLLDGQSLKTERGERLASSYNYCLVYTDALKESSTGLLRGGDDEARTRAVKAQGRLEFAGGECTGGVLFQSGIRAGMTDEAALAAASEPMQKINEALASIGGRSGALTEGDRTKLTALASTADELAGVLGAYSAPKGADRFRQMQAGVDWPPVAQRFVDELNRAAADIG